MTDWWELLSGFENGSFEADDWYPEADGYGYDISTEQAKSGTHSAKPHEDEQGGLIHDLNCNPTGYYALRIWFKIVGTVPTGYSGGIFVRFFFNDYSELQLYIETGNLGNPATPKLRLDFRSKPVQRGSTSISLDEWHCLHIKCEVGKVDAICNIYLDDLENPELTVSDNMTGVTFDDSPSIEIQPIAYTGSYTGRNFIDGIVGACDAEGDFPIILPPIPSINPYTLYIDNVPRDYIKIHYVKNHPSEDPDTFEITVNRDVGELVNYFDSVEVTKKGVTEFYGFIEEITQQKGQDGLEYLLTGRCWKLVPWKKQTERYQESREVGPEDAEGNLETGFFGNVYPHELFKFILRCPISEHPKGKVRHKIGWGIASDYWKCCANVTADAHYPDWVFLRYVGLAWRNRGSASSFNEEQLDVDAYNQIVRDWNTMPSSPDAGPWIDSPDNGEYIHVYYVYEDPNKTMSEFTFENLVGSYSSFISVTVNIKIACPTGYTKVAVWIYSITEGWQVAGYIEWGYGTPTYKSIDVSSILDSSAKINGAKIAFTSINAVYSWAHPYIYHAYLHVKGWLDTEGANLQQTDDYFIVDLGAIKEDVTAMLVESRVEETMYARNYQIQYCILSNCGNNTTYPPDESDWLDFDDDGAIVKHNNTARDILHSWKPVDARCIRIKLVADAEPPWEISQIYIWQADNSKYRTLNE